MRLLVVLGPQIVVLGFLERLVFQRFRLGQGDFHGFGRRNLVVDRRGSDLKGLRGCGLFDRLLDDRLGRRNRLRPGRAAPLGLLRCGEGQGRGVRLDVPRKLPRGHAEGAEQFENMLVAREHEQLVPRLGELAQQFGGRPGTLGVEVHQHVVEHQGQRGAAPRVRGGQRQPQRQEQLLARAPAEHLDPQRIALVVVDAQRVFA